MVNRSPGTARPHHHGARCRVDPDVVDSSKIDHKRVITHAQSCCIMPAAADRNSPSTCASQTDCRQYICGARAAGNHPRLAVDHRVVNFARLVISRIVRLNYGAAELGTEMLERVFKSHIFVPQIQCARAGVLKPFCLVRVRRSLQAMLQSTRKRQ